MLKNNDVIEMVWSTKKDFTKIFPDKFQENHKVTKRFHEKRKISKIGRVKKIISMLKKLIKEYKD